MPHLCLWAYSSMYMVRLKSSSRREDNVYLLSYTLTWDLVFSLNS